MDEFGSWKVSKMIKIVEWRERERERNQLVGVALKKDFDLQFKI